MFVEQTGYRMKPDVESLIEKYKKRTAGKPPAAVLHIARVLRKHGHDSAVSQATAWALWAKYDGPTRTASELMPRIASALEQEAAPLCRFIEAKWSSRPVLGGAANGTKAIGSILAEGESEDPDVQDEINTHYENIREASGRAANLTAHIARHLGESEQVAIAGGMFASQIITKLGHKLLHEI
jgi:hypothetical protein